MPGFCCTSMPIRMALGHVGVASPPRAPSSPYHGGRCGTTSKAGPFLPSLDPPHRADLGGNPPPCNATPCSADVDIYPANVAYSRSSGTTKRTYTRRNVAKNVAPAPLSLKGPVLASSAAPSAP